MASNYTNCVFDEFSRVVNNVRSEREMNRGWDDICIKKKNPSL